MQPVERRLASTLRGFERATGFPICFRALSPDWRHADLGSLLGTTPHFARLLVQVEPLLRGFATKIVAPFVSAPHDGMTDFGFDGNGVAGQLY